MKKPRCDYEQAKSRVTKEMLEDAYINKNMSRAECLEFFDISVDCFKRLNKEYGITKNFDLRVKKQKSTLMERYGVDAAIKIPGVKEKVENTNKERYGAACSLSNAGVREKCKSTTLERYGKEFYSSTQECREKIKQTNLQRYGTEYASQLAEVKEKVKNTVREKYGVDNVFQAEEIKNKAKSTNVDRYGVEYITSSPEIKEKVRQTNMERYGFVCSLNNPEIKEKAKQTNLEKYGVEWFCLLPECINGTKGSESGPNVKFASLLEKEGIEYTKEFVIGNYRYDFKVGNNLIEINPSFTHNSTYGYRGYHEPMKNTYHQNKSKVAKEAGYRCMHVWDWDDLDKVIELLKPRDKVYARKCEVKVVDVNVAAGFIKVHHLQGNTKADVYLGLYKEDELVSVMSFGKPRYNKKYQWEILRYCSVLNVVGGAEKLWKYFRDTYRPESCISYCDLSKFNGDVYEKLGFTLKRGNINPSAHWFGIRDERHITDNLLRQRGFDQLFGTNYGKGTSNEELIIAEGYVKVYDCGQATYIWNKKESQL